MHIPKIHHSPEGLEAFVQLFIHPSTAFGQKGRAKRDISELVNPRDQASRPRTLKGAMILICGHNTRDTRCGILGPLLDAEFGSYLNAYTSYSPHRTQPPPYIEPSIGSSSSRQQYISLISGSNVALTSHIGGHAFAGNVVIYLPKTFKMASGKLSPLGGMGIWYGRVEPRHVWGIMEETVQRGSVIQELLRGIHRPVDIGGYDWVDWL